MQNKKKKDRQLKITELDNKQTANVSFLFEMRTRVDRLLSYMSLGWELIDKYLRTKQHPFEFVFLPVGRWMVPFSLSLFRAYLVLSPFSHRSSMRRHANVFLTKRILKQVVSSLLL